MKTRKAEIGNQRSEVRGRTAGALHSMAAEAAGLKEVLGGPVTDSVADWIGAEYAATARRVLGKATGARRLEILRAFARDWHLLRRGDHSAERLQLSREKFDWMREDSRSEREKAFWEWTKRPEIREKLYPNKDDVISEETIRKIEKELRLL